MSVAVFIHSCSSQDKAPAAKRLRSSLGLFTTETNVFGVGNKNQQSISQLVELPEHRVVEECATPMACTEKQAHSEVLSPACRSTRTMHCLIDMGKIIRHNPYEWSDYVQKVSSVLMTPVTQPTKDVL